MIEILPAIIPRSFKDLQEKVVSVSYFASMIHLDVIDGVWVPSQSWPFNSLNDEDFAKVISQDQGLPEWETVDYEVHLMVAHPENEIEKWMQAGARRLVVHIEAVENMAEVILLLKEKYQYTNDPAYTDLEFGIAIKLDTPLEKIIPFIPDIHFVQCMGIMRVGQQGQLCDVRVFEKIKALRAMFPTLVISGDGGVTLENAHEWVEAGASRLVSGSAIYKSENISETIDELRHLDEQ